MNTIIFTDGASRGNPGPGGWSSVIIENGKVIELGGGEKNTTNNRMELTAAIEGLNAVSGDEPITIYIDSSYVIKGIAQWIKGWKRNGWVTKTKDDVLNKDLWMKLDAATSGKSIKWEYVGGHIGIAGNERCDEIATAYADGTKPDLYSGDLAGYSVKNITDIRYDEVKLAEKNSKSSRSNAPAYSYVSAVKGVVKTHPTWADCEKRVKGVKGARFKKALNKGNEEELVKEFGGGTK